MIYICIYNVVCICVYVCGGGLGDRARGGYFNKHFNSPKFLFGHERRKRYLLKWLQIIETQIKYNFQSELCKVCGVRD